MPKFVAIGLRVLILHGTGVTVQRVIYSKRPGLLFGYSCAFDKRRTIHTVHGAIGKRGVAETRPRHVRNTTVTLSLLPPELLPVARRAVVTGNTVILVAADITRINSRKRLVSTQGSDKM